MKKLTRSQARKIRKAIRLAKSPGRCIYADSGKPICLIGQLCHLEHLQMPLEGKTIDELPRHPIHLQYDSRLLKQLQRVFDSPEEHKSLYDDDSMEELNRERLNNKLRSIVKKYETCKP